jgi:hypothetical protein
MSKQKAMLPYQIQPMHQTGDFSTGLFGCFADAYVSARSHPVDTFASPSPSRPGPRGLDVVPARHLTQRHTD